VLGAMGAVAVLFIVETMWSGINKQLNIEEMATSAAEKFSQEAGRRKSMMIDGLKSKTVWRTKDVDA
jgi:hypothetical protein